MKPQSFHIKTIGDGTFGAMAMPNAASLEADLLVLKKAGTDKILCLLEEPESLDLGLADQQTLTEKAGMEFQRFPITDYGVPDFLDLQVLITSLLKEISAGKNLIIHCRGGVGRTGLICCCLMSTTGMSVPDAIAHVTKQRGAQVPETPAQIDMIIRYAARNRNL